MRDEGWSLGGPPGSGVAIMHDRNRTARTGSDGSGLRRLREILQSQGLNIEALFRE